jgi:hypothetical protein
MRDRSRGGWRSPSARRAALALVLGPGLLGSWGCGAVDGAEEEPPPEAGATSASDLPQPLEGDWVMTRYVETLERTRDPEAALRTLGGDQPSMLRISRNGNGEIWLAVLNFHEAVVAHVAERGAATEGGTVTFSRPFDWPPLQGAHRVRLLEDGLLRWNVESGSAAREWVLRRVEPSVELWASRVVLGGIYGDNAGRTFDFRDDGTLVRNGQSHRYRVHLDMVGVGCPYLELDPTGPDQARRAIFGFRRDGERLLLFDAGSEAEPEISCEGTPLSILTPRASSR